jgi:phosphopantetheinyl transferase
VIRYAARPLPGAVPGIRPPKAVERDAGRALQAGLDPAAALFSRSHGRGLIAAAVAAPPVTALGIDIEWMDPARRMPTIAAHFLGQAPDDLTPEQFYRGWTFGEAWFKVFGANPPLDLIRIAGANRSGSTIAVGPAWLLQTLPAPGFVLSLVWAGPAGVACETA